MEQHDTCCGEYWNFDRSCEWFDYRNNNCYLYIADRMYYLKSGYSKHYTNCHCRFINRLPGWHNYTYRYCDRRFMVQRHSDHRINRYVERYCNRISYRGYYYYLLAWYRLHGNQNHNCRAIACSYNRQQQYLYFRDNANDRCNNRWHMECGHGERECEQHRGSNRSSSRSSNY